MSEVGGWQADAESALKRVEGQLSLAQQNAARVSRLRRCLDRLRGEACSPQGEVVATTDTTGRLVELRLTAAALAMSPDELSGLILETVDAARHQAGTRAITIAARRLGKSSPAVAVLAAELRRPAATAADR